jgi:hypothetical protein
MNKKQFNFFYFNMKIHVTKIMKTKFIILINSINKNKKGLVKHKASLI